MTENEVLIHVDDLKMHFPIYRGVIRRQLGQYALWTALVSKSIAERRLGGGESGCGKSTTGRTMLQLIPTYRRQGFL